jgi:hypothetical protein
MNASFQGGIVRKSERRRMVGRAWRLDELPLNILQAPDRGIGEYIEDRRGEIEARERLLSMVGVLKHRYTHS